MQAFPFAAAGPPFSRQSLARVLIYSHDTFGLGHLRRSRAIANALVSERPGVSVLIISGSPVIGNFEFGSGVDYVRIPGVTKLPDGDYRSLNLNVSIDEAAELRETIILQTAESFRPDLFIVDKEPTGFRGEIVPALERLQQHGCRLVLGIRDVMDEPALLATEWERKGAVEALRRYYDEVWVYGLREIYEPLVALDLPRDVERRIAYTGYLRREIPQRSALTRYPKLTKSPFVLVTTGGGGDGDDLIDWVVSAYEAEPDDRAAGPRRLRALREPGPATRLPRAHRPPPEARRHRLRHQDRAADGQGRPPSSRWAATTRSARSCRSTSAP